MGDEQELRRLLDEVTAEKNALSRRLVAVLEATERHVMSLRGVAHDLRNPLAVLGTETLRMEQLLVDGDPGLRELLEDHVAAVTQCEELIDELLLLGRESSAASRLRVEAVDVHVFAARLDRKLAALVAGRGIETSARTMGEAPPTVDIDPFVLDRIIDNLVTNAVANAPSGSVEVVVDGDGLDWLIIDVTDTAGGLPPDVLECLRGGDLSPLERPDGHGIGLSVVVDLLRLVGGRMQVSTRPGEGSTFRCRLPSQPHRALSSSGVRPSSRIVTVLDEEPATPRAGDGGVR